MTNQIRAALLASTATIALGWPAQAGMRQHTPPPPNFPIESAGPQDLQALGLPPDTQDHPNLMKALHDPRLHTPPPVEGLPAMHMRPHLSAGERGRAAGGATSVNWSGQVNVVPIPAASATIECEMIIPAVTSHDGALDFVAHWCGFGGWIDNTVLQAGVVCSSTFPCAAWYERFPDPLINTYRVNNGDDVQVFVWHTTVAPHGHAIVYDATNGGYSNVSFDCQSCGDPPLTSKEWIVEAPEVGGAIVTLANYHSIVMINSSYNAGGSGPGGASPTNFNVEMMQNGVAVSNCPTPNRWTMVCEAYR